MAREVTQMLRDVSVDAVRLPPQAIEAERNVLGILMLDNTAYDRISDVVQERDFYRLEHRKAFKVICGLIECNRPADALTVAEAEGGDLAALSTMAMDVTATGNVRRYAQIVRDRSRKRAMASLATDLAEKAYSPTTDTDTALDDAIEQLYALKGAERRGSRPIGDVLTKVVERIDMLYSRVDKNDVIGVSTGFVDLDRYTSGFQPGDLIIVAGRPSMGKTALVMNMTEHVGVRLQLPVIVFSLEMSDEQLVQRMIGSVGHLDQHELRTGRFKEDDWRLVTDAVSVLDRAPIVIEETSGLTAGAVRSIAHREHRQRGGLGLIVIDYLQLMATAGDNRNNELGEITRQLKALAKDLRVPVVLLSQLNRGVEQRANKRPMISDLRDSGSIEQDADVVLLIYRDEFYNPESQAKGIAEVNIAKQRNGPVGTVNLTFLGKYTRFENYAGGDLSYAPALTKRTARNFYDHKSAAAGGE